MLLQILDKIVSSPTLLFGTFLAISFLVGATKHWLTDQSLRDRQQFDDDQFAKSFFAGNQRTADIAVRVRKILSDNLEISLGGIRPEDKLNDDLDTQLSANPDLFWELEKAFGIDAMVENLDEFERITTEIVTFADLVKYIEAKVDELPKRANKKKGEFEIDADDRIGDIVAAMWFGGLTTYFVGDAFGYNRVAAIGLTTAFLPFAAGGFYMCSKMIGEVIKISKDEGLRILMEHPFSTLMSLAIFAAFFSAGAWFSWGIMQLWFGEV